MSDTQTVREQYDRFAGVYDVLWRGYTRCTLPLLMNAARIGPGERVLDIGSGTGALEERIAQAVPRVEVVGVDMASAMIEKARRKLSGIPAVFFERADAHALPFEKERFDAVVSASTFHYFERPQEVLHEMTRVLRPGGRFVVLDWCRDFWTCQVMDIVLRLFDPAHTGCYTLEEMHALVKASPLTSWRASRQRCGIVWGLMAAETLKGSVGIGG